MAHLNAKNNDLDQSVSQLSPAHAQSMNLSSRRDELSIPILEKSITLGNIERSLRYSLSLTEVNGA